MALASSVNTSYLRPKRSGGRLVAVGIPDYVGSEKQVWEVDIRDESECARPGAPSLLSTSARDPLLT
jgi:uncharacterized protein (TIGR00369 family)